MSDTEQAALPPQAPTQADTHTVARVIDGDTIQLANGERVRYIGIDTPETKHPSKPVEPFGHEASEYNRSLVEGKQVRLELDAQERDRYGRLLAYVWVGDVFVNAELVRAGYAQVATYPPNVRHQDLFLKLQREARDAERGLWGRANESAHAIPGTEQSEATRLPPAKQQADQATTVYVTRTGTKYHAAGCRYLQKSSTPVPLNDAVARGYTPCSVCSPPRASGSVSSGAARAPPTATRQEESGGGETVYITRTGSKYHRGTCSYLRSSRIPIQKSEAIRRGLGPCSRCRP